MVRSRKKKVSVLLVDDHAVVREDYRRLLERQGDISVLAEAGDAATAHALFCRLEPQIVVMDISLPGTSGIEAMRRMLVYEPTARVLIFSMHEETIFSRRALQRGSLRSRSMPWRSESTLRAIQYSRRTLRWPSSVRSIMSIRR